MQDEHALFLSHFLSQKQNLARFVHSTSRIQLWPCAGESTGEGQGSLCTLAAAVGEATLWQKIGSQRGGEGPR